MSRSFAASAVAEPAGAGATAARVVVGFWTGAIGGALASFWSVEGAAFAEGGAAAGGFGGGCTVFLVTGDAVSGRRTSMLVPPDFGFFSVAVYSASQASQM